MIIQKPVHVCVRFQLKHLSIRILATSTKYMEVFVLRLSPKASYSFTAQHMLLYHVIWNNNVWVRGIACYTVEYTAGRSDVWLAIQLHHWLSGSRPVMWIYLVVVWRRLASVLPCVFHVCDLLVVFFAACLLSASHCCMAVLLMHSADDCASGVVVLSCATLACTRFIVACRACWLGLLTCKNRLPYNLYSVGGDVKHCRIQSNPSTVNASTLIPQYKQDRWCLVLTMADVNRLSNFHRKIYNSVRSTTPASPRLCCCTTL